MTIPEISRADLLAKISEKKVTQSEVANILGLTLRHVQRLYANFKKNGITSLVSRKRGKPSNHQLPPLQKARIKELITCEAYHDFGPTFMCEKLKELHGIPICPETTRQFMIINGMWKANVKRRPAIHQQRKRRGSFGELTQIDGSPHAWFEDRGDPCVLIVFIDDATGRTYGKFFETETTHAYMITLWEYITKYGRPLAVYSDKHGIFRVNIPGSTRKDCFTQFGRALRELDISLIWANSPQAKGRVERCNQTQQDRLVKEMRLANVSTIEEANQFLTKTKYWDKFNNKFGVIPENKKDRHRKLLKEQNLEKILCHKEVRTVSKNLEIQYENITYQIIIKKPSTVLRKAKVSVIKTLENEIFIEYKGKSLMYKIYTQQEFVGKEVSSKEIDRFFKEKKERKVSNVHPWNQQGRASAEQRRYQNI